MVAGSNPAVPNSLSTAQGNETVEKVWLKSYPPGVPAEIDADAYHSLVQLFETSCQQHADAPAFYSMGKTITYRELDAYTRDFAAYLQNELKLKKGDRFAIMLPNVLQYPIAMFGALRAGLVIVNVNPLYTVDELKHQMNDSGADALLVLTNFANVVQKALPQMQSLKHILVTNVGDMLSPVKGFITNFVLKYVLKKVPDWSLPNSLDFKATLNKGKKLKATPVDLRGEDIAFLQYTGGTTGVSKGAVLTHRNLIANIQQARAWFDSMLSGGHEIIITALPLYHIFSLTANCFFFTMIGGLNVLIVNPRDIPGSIKEMSKFQFTAITGVNTLFNGLMKDPSFEKLDFSKLRLSLGGGMAVQQVVAERWQK